MPRGHLIFTSRHITEISFSRGLNRLRTRYVSPLTYNYYSSEFGSLIDANYVPDRDLPKGHECCWFPFSFAIIFCLSTFLAVIVVLFLLKTTIFTFSDEPRDAGPFFSLLQGGTSTKEKTMIPFFIFRFAELSYNLTAQKIVGTGSPASNS